MPGAACGARRSLRGGRPRPSNSAALAHDAVRLRSRSIRGRRTGTTATAQALAPRGERHRHRRRRGRASTGVRGCRRDAPHVSAPRPPGPRDGRAAGARARAGNRVGSAGWRTRSAPSTSSATGRASARYGGRSGSTPSAATQSCSRRGTKGSTTTTSARTSSISSTAAKGVSKSTARHGSSVPAASATSSRRRPARCRTLRRTRILWSSSSAVRTATSAGTARWSIRLTSSVVARSPIRPEPEGVSEEPHTRGERDSFEDHVHRAPDRAAGKRIGKKDREERRPRKDDADQQRMAAEPEAPEDRNEPQDRLQVFEGIPGRTLRHRPEPSGYEQTRGRPRQSKRSGTTDAEDDRRPPDGLWPALQGRVDRERKDGDPARTDGDQSPAAQQVNLVRRHDIRIPPADRANERERARDERELRREDDEPRGGERDGEFDAIADEEIVRFVREHERSREPRTCCRERRKRCIGGSARLRRRQLVSEAFRDDDGGTEARYALRIRAQVVLRLQQDALPEPPSYADGGERGGELSHIRLDHPKTASTARTSAFHSCRRVDKAPRPRRVRR